MRIPGAERAEVALAKLSGYCLSPAHEWGKHKARVFAARLGLTRSDVFLLRAALLAAAEARDDATLGVVDGFGARYVLDFPLTGPKGTALVRSTWIILHDEDFPRFVTCYVL
jgi:hypothetical protein